MQLWWSKAETRFWPVKGILVISWSTELQIRWFLMHWKAGSKSYNFMIYTRAIWASNIEKISVEIRQKNRARMNSAQKSTNLKRVKQGVKTRAQAVFSTYVLVDFSCNLFCNLCSFHTTFLTIFLQRFRLKMIRWAWKLWEVIFESFKSQKWQLEITSLALEFLYKYSLWRPF